MARTAQVDVITPAPAPALYVALELSKATWKLGFTTGRAQRVRIRDVPARETVRFLAEVAQAKRRLGLLPDAPVRSCYEAGRDGFWIHRFLEAEGIKNLVFDPASIQVDRRAKQVKTDRLDVQRLARLLVRQHEGERVVRTVRVPPAEVEDERTLPRMLKRLKETRKTTTNRIRSVLFLHGLDLDPRRASFREVLATAGQWDGEPLPSMVLLEVELLLEQLDLLERQIKQLAQRQRAALRAARRGDPEATACQRVAARLTELCGIGDVGAYVLSTEFFAWRDFKNRKEVGALAGLTGTPFSSGSEQRDQGISKAGNSRVRTLMVELAWGWLRWQPESRTSRWFHDHIGQAGSRSRRKAIVAVARKLLVELWHYIAHGVYPDGAVLKAERASMRGAA